MEELCIKILNFFSVYPIYFDVSLLKKSHSLISNKICHLHIYFFCLFVSISFETFSLPQMLKALTSWDSLLPEAACSLCQEVIH